MMVMIGQILAMWLIVGWTIVWFVRDEKRRYDAVLRAKAMHFAKAPHYRHPEPQEPEIFGL
ncbi:MAG: hypothetical protein JWR51_3997 [Devosia sp.]|nr:hypothetical protein [Devosia sp.]